MNSGTNELLWIAISVRGYFLLQPIRYEAITVRIRFFSSLIALAQNDNKKINIEKINDFIKKHYLEKNDKKNLDDRIVNQGKFHQKRIRSGASLNS